MAERSDRQAEAQRTSRNDRANSAQPAPALEGSVSGERASSAVVEADRGEARDDGADTVLVKVSKTVAIYACGVLVVFAYLVLSEPTCSSGSVDDSVMDLIESKLLHVKRFSVKLTNITALKHGFFGDQRCSADVVIDGRPTPHRVEYHWTTHRGSLETVYAKLTS